MAFALALAKGEAEPEECPHLDQEQRDALEAFKGEDWRLELIRRLEEEVSGISLPDCAESLGADLVGDELKIRCIGTDYMVGPGGEVSTSGYINPWINILLLHYIRRGGSGQITGRWVSFSELKDGMVKAFSFTRDCEEPLRELLDQDFSRIEKALHVLGVNPVESASADYAWEICLLPKLPMLIYYWVGDTDTDEPGSSAVKILLDSTADRFLDVETLVFLAMGLISVLRYFK